MSSLAWMPFYVSDYLADTGHLTTVEHGAYLLLIMHYWQHGGLPIEDRKLANICRLSGKGWASIRGTIIELFSGDDWRHERIEKELDKSRLVSGKRHAAGKAGAEARHGKGKTEAPIAAKQTHTPLPSPSQEHLAAKVETTPQAAEPPGLRGKYDLDELEVACRSAAGLSDAGNAGLLDLSPIVELLEAGYDLEVNVLPILRAKSGQGKTPSTWRYYVKAIVEAKASNGRLITSAGTVPAGLDPNKPPSVFVFKENPSFQALRDRYRTEKGSDPPTYEKVGGSGWWFDPSWLPAQEVAA